MSRTALFVRWVLGISSAVFLLLGLAFVFTPNTMIGAIDIEAGSPKAMADIRAVYGGLDLFLGILLAICFFRKQFAEGLALSALACTCLFLGRLAGMLIDGANDILTFGLFASEVLGAVLAAIAWFLARQPEPAPAAAELVSTPDRSTEAPPADPGVDA